jgi:FkbM family methyltransferase
MNDRLQYTIRGWAYTAECLNPFRSTITINDLPLGLKLQAYKRDAVGRGLYRRKIHEPALTNLLLSRFATPAQRTFIDVGANIGYFSCLLSKLAGPSGTVLAVEPEPKNFQLLEHNLRMNRLENVVVHRCALGASDGTAMLGLYKPSNRGRHSIVDANPKSAIEVRVRALDELVKSSTSHVSSWSLLKVDVEGYEGLMMEGAKETISRTETLVMEFSPELLKKTGVDPASMLQTLSSQFPRIHRIAVTELVRTSVNECLASNDQLELVFDR